MNKGSTAPELTPRYSQRPRQPMASKAEHCVYCDRISNDQDDSHILTNGQLIHKECFNYILYGAKPTPKQVPEFFPSSNIRDKGYLLCSLETELGIKENKFFGLFFNNAEREIYTKKIKTIKSEIQSLEGVERRQFDQNVRIIEENNQEIVNKMNLIDTLRVKVFDSFPSYPPDWGLRREQIFSQCGRRCENCGNRKMLQVHHKVPLSRGGTNKIYNLKVMCVTCHQKAHGGKNFGNRPFDSSHLFGVKIKKIKTAILEGRKVSFKYQKFGEKSAATRKILPLDIVNMDWKRKDGSTLCVEGYCYKRDSDRTFAVKRMTHVSIL